MASNANLYAPYNRNLEQFVQVGRETYMANSGDIAIPHGTVTKAQTGFGQGNVFSPIPVAATALPLPPGDAIRVVKGSWCSCQSDEAADVTTLLCESLVLVLIDRFGSFVRAWPGNYSGNALGQTGQFLNTTDDELIFGNDYANIGGSPFTFFCIADVRNSAAALPGNIILQGLVTIERWRLSSTSRMRG